MIGNRNKWAEENVEKHRKECVSTSRRVSRALMCILKSALKQLATREGAQLAATICSFSCW